MLYVGTYLCSEDRLETVSDVNDGKDGEYKEEEEQHFYQGNKKKPRSRKMVKAAAKSVVEDTNTVNPIINPTLVISEATATDFMKEINGTGVAIDNPKQEAFINSLVKAAKKPRVKKEKAEKPSPEKDKTESAAEKASLIAKITLNVNAFESLLRDFIQPSREAYLAALPKKSVAELEIVFKTLEHSRVVGNATNQLKHLLFLGASAVEMATQSVGLKTQGYAQALRAQETEIRMILQEIAIERAETMEKYQRPEVRLAVILTSTLMAMDNANRLRDLNVKADVTIQPAINEQYKDL